MKPLSKTTSSRVKEAVKSLVQREANRTACSCKYTRGRTDENNAPKLSETDFAALARFSEAVFVSATALLDRLQKLQPDDPSLAEIGALLKRAGLSFGGFKARTQGCPTGVTP